MGDIASPPTDHAPAVTWSQNSTLDVEGLYRDYGPTAAGKALELLQEMHAHEPDITRDITEVAQLVDAKAEGLECRLKSPQSLARKIRDTPRSDPDEVALINDAVRYTIMVQKHNDIVSCTRRTVRALTKRGWKVLSAEHSYVRGNPYKGVHLIMCTPDGVSTEVQFHSKTSLSMKEINHVDYEINRDERSQARRARIAADQRMRDRYAALRSPAGLSSLKTLGGVAVKAKTYQVPRSTTVAGVVGRS